MMLRKVADNSRSPTNKSIPRSESGASSGSSTASSEHLDNEDGLHIESSSETNCFCESDEAIHLRSANVESKCHQQRLDHTVGAPHTVQIPPANVNQSRRAINNIPELTSSGSAQHEELEGLSTCVGEVNGMRTTYNSDSSPVPIVSDPRTVSQSHGDEIIQDFIPSGSLLHIDVVSIPSSVLPNINNEMSTHEERRNSGRMVLDAFSNHSSRTRTDLPAMIFGAEDNDLVGPHRRWLLGIGDDFFNDGLSIDSWHFGRRSRITNERWQTSRSQFWDRLQGATRESTYSTPCPFDLHPAGSCSCGVDEEASDLASVSRIVLLAEALFEVLNEIHRQPEPFSLSMRSLPAPESVVDSLPLRTYKKLETANDGENVDQCHICLVEYEEGDNIRVLPCHHEYHVSCVDKWLKEVHGVCPLCRQDVREQVRDGAASSSDADLT